MKKLLRREDRPIDQTNEQASEQSDQEKRMSFVETDSNPAPGGGSVRWVEGKDGAPIRTAVWPNPDGGRGTMFVLPGKSEYIEKYFEVVGELLTRGFSVVVLDWRGQGLSHREVDHPTKAFIGRFEDFLDDFEAVFDMHSKELQGPWYGLAHSMGGNVLLRLVGEHRIPFEAVVTTAPMTGLNMPPFWEKTAEVVVQSAVGFGAGDLFIPGASSYDPLVEKFEDNSVTSDPARHARTAAIVQALPAIAQGGATYAWIHEAFKSIKVIVRPEFGRGIRIPVLILGAADDRLVDPVTNRYVGVNIPGAEFHMVDDAEHEILMERDPLREVFWTYFDDFMARVTAQAA